MTYGYLIYDYASLYAGDDVTPPLFDSVSNVADFFPNGMIGYNKSKNGTITPNWGSTNVVAYLICKSIVWTQEMTDAINDSVTAWNLANPSNQMNAAKVIFTEAEKSEVNSQLLDRQTEIINIFEGI
jgi:hypothetical protein